MEKTMSVKELQLEIKSLKFDNAKLTQWVSDLQSGMWINCVYCGHRYGPHDKTPVSKANVLYEHIKKCAKHPLSKALAENRRLRKKIKDFKNKSDMGAIPGDFY